MRLPAHGLQGIAAVAGSVADVDAMQAVLDALRQLLQDEDDDVRSAAIGQLHALGEWCMPSLSACGLASNGSFEHRCIC